MEMKIQLFLIYFTLGDFLLLYGVWSGFLFMFTQRGFGFGTTQFSLGPLDEESFACCHESQNLVLLLCQKVPCHASGTGKKLCICNFLNPDMQNSAQVGLGSFSIKTNLRPSGCIVIRYFL
jgi:hypothetical protein